LGEKVNFFFFLLTFGGATNAERNRRVMVRVEDARHQLGEREKMMERTSLFEILVVWTFDRFENLGGFFLVMINAA